MVMIKVLENTFENISYSFIDRLYRFSDGFFDDTKERKDIMENQYIRFLVSNTGLIYIALRKESDKYLPILYDKLKDYAGFGFEKFRKISKYLIESLLNTGNKKEKNNLKDDKLCFKSSVSVKFEKFGYWLFTSEDKKEQGKKSQTSFIKIQDHNNTRETFPGSILIILFINFYSKIFLNLFKFFSSS